VPLRLLPASLRNRMRSAMPMKLARPSVHSMAVGLIVVTTGFLMIASSFAQETATVQRSTNGTAGAKVRRAQLPFAKGTLTANDLLRRVLKIKTKDGTRTFFYTEHTYIFRGKEKITADKLILGETIALRFDLDSEGRAMVRRIKAYGVAQPAEVKPSDAAESPKQSER
jgi:hypothetical protein